MKAFFIYLSIFIFCNSISGDNFKERYYFDDPVDQQRFVNLLEDLRCPKCQFSNLSGSNAPIAQDLKLEVYNLIVEGKSDKEITEFLTSRYGNYILYKPPLEVNTLILWMGPFVFLLLILAILFYLRSSSRTRFKNSKDLR